MKLHVQDAIRAARGGRGKKDFACELGISADYVALFEYGHRRLSFERAVDWARLLELPTHYFVQALVLDELAAVNAVTVVRVGSVAA